MRDPAKSLRFSLGAALGAALFASCALSQESRPAPPPEERVVQSVQIGGLELSGLARVNGGLLLVDDEQVGSLLFVSDEDLAGPKAPLSGLQVKLERKRKSSQPYTDLPRLFAVQDIEDLASDGDDTLYVLGSHAGKIGKGGEVDRRPDREFLVRAEWDAKGRRLQVRSTHDSGKRGLYTGLLDALQASEPAAVTSFVNAEGLALKGKKELFVGLRAPLAKDRQAYVFRAKTKHLFGDADDLEGPKDGPRFETLTLDLGGGAVRGLHWDRLRERLLVVSGPSGEEQSETFGLWTYDPEEKASVKVRAFSLAFVGANGAPEAVCRLDDETLLVACDAEGALGGGLLRVPYPGR